MKNNTNTVIFFDGFSIWIDEILILDDINLRINGPNLIVLYGQRGSGKSTLLREIIRLNDDIYRRIKRKGRILFNDQKVHIAIAKDLRKEVSYIDTFFIESTDILNFKDMIDITLSKSRVSLEEFAEKLEAFDILRFLPSGLKTKIRDLYPFEKIMIFLFLSIVRNSNVIILDCVLDHVDDDALENLSKYLSMLSEDRLVIVSTRNLQRFLPISDFLIVLKDGKIGYAGKPDMYAFKG